MSWAQQNLTISITRENTPIEKNKYAVKPVLLSVIFISPF